MMKAMICQVCSSNSFTLVGENQVCDYCRTTYTPAQAQTLQMEGTVTVDRSADVNNLLMIGHTALTSHNALEAYAYANRVLEIESNHAAAWLLKARSLGQISTPDDIRLMEMLGAFKQVVEYSGGDERAGLRQEYANFVNRAAWQHYQQTLHSLKAQITHQELWLQHVKNGEQLIPVLQQTYEWEQQRESLDVLVEICSKLVEGMKYQDADKKVFFHRLAPQSEKYLQQYVAYAGKEIQKFDASYIVPEPKRKKCFVVTATMGNENSTPVVLLRDFRDDVLVRSRTGRRFIDWYYRNGPHVAQVVSRSVVLRAVSFALVVAPATAIAWVWKRLQ